jgi:hypothetical protein
MKLLSNWDASVDPCSAPTCAPCRFSDAACGVVVNATALCNYFYISCDAGRVVGIHLGGYLPGLLCVQRW